MKIRKLLNEMKQVGILYHYCTYKVFEDIVDSDLILKDTLNRGTISFTRLGAGIYRFGECRFVLDGNKMSNKFKIVPDSLARLPNKQGKFIKDGKPRYKSSIEKQGEERIYDIDSFDMKPYLLAIQINSTDNFYDSDLERIQNKISKITNIPFEVNNNGSWITYRRNYENF